MATDRAQARRLHRATGSACIACVAFGALAGCVSHGSGVSTEGADARVAGTVSTLDAGGSDGAAVPVPGPPGLVATQQILVPGGHAIAAAVLGQTVFVASSFGVFTAVDVPATGRASLVWSSGGLDRPDTSARCTQIAAHASTHTVYCASLDVSGLDSWNVTDPTNPARLPSALRTYRSPGPLDLAVAGDALLVLRSDGSVASRAIDREGAPGPEVPVTPPGTGRKLGADGARFVTVDDAGVLHAYARMSGAWQEAGSVALDGPAMRVEVLGDRAFVALGSEGSAVVSLGANTASVLRRIATDGVVYAIEGGDPDALLLGTTAGIELLDTHGSDVRVAGMEPEAVGVMDLVRVNGRVLSVDWNWVELHTVDRGGHAVAVDTPSGSSYVQGQGARIELRNPGDVALSVVMERTGASDVAASVTVPAGARAMVEIGAAAIGTEGVPVSTWEAREQGCTDAWCASAMVSFVRTDVVRGDVAIPPRVGGRFPVMLDPRADSPAPRVPLMDTVTRVLVLEPDCALQWNEVRDTTWLADHHTLPDDARPVVLVVSDTGSSPWTVDGLRAQLGLGTVPMPLVIAYAESLLGHPPGPGVDSDQIDVAFLGAPYLRGADTTVHYTIDAHGTVTAFERLYRGRHPLMVAPIPP